ncbi:MAG TPA: sigma-70 family RNA polymerase sigma factor [Acidimicrobiales bacterium]|nr:sigma-70 family RNA polymerase sigma factor [Acidimicrobiales bacterium]
MHEATITERPVEVTDDFEASRAVPVAPSASAGTARRPSAVGAPEGLAADQAGLREAFLAHGSELLGFARRSLRGDALAEDVVQETFTRAWRSRARFDPTLGSLRTWLFAIERRVLVDTVVRQAKHRADPLDEADAGAEDRVDAALVGWQVAAVLDKLDAPHRLVLTELYFNGRTSREVAALFGIPEGTVRSRAFYALRTMRAMLDEIGWSQ